MSSAGQASQPAALPSAEAQPTKIAKVTKKRAARACINCRTRKVRCDCVETYPSPCNNCAHEGVECVVVETRRKKLVGTDRFGCFALDRRLTRRLALTPQKTASCSAPHSNLDGTHPGCRGTSPSHDWQCTHRQFCRASPWSHL
ncbi:hypothetical protein QBC42DRAFT_1777 [Cladorrhinum samala]|uniref:Zn(2)-C6 fungal-type domain-containing protein n=1 Tax=Cladorrhinum samala TaxID=585594 RepID=A0AAV9I436_9PEZI|nr:hypothetical protein QBC42DRAFT_1777 [Cladorrhinum samala]